MEKDFFKRVCCLALLWLSTLCLSVVHASTLIDGLYYDLDTSNRTATVTYETKGSNNYALLPADVVIPESVTYEGITYSVTKIGNEAFANCKMLESISVPSTVVQIGKEDKYSSLAFSGCTSLKRVRFEDGTQKLVLGASYNTDYKSNYGRGLFLSCPLEEVYIGRNISYENNYYTFEEYPQYYGYSAFYNQPNLAKVTISSTVTEIPICLFKGCSVLSNVSIHGRLTKIPAYSFDGCNLSTLNLSNSIEEIGDYAFRNNTALTTVSLGGNIKTIGGFAFYKTSVSSINIPNNVTIIGESCFAENTKLEKVTIGTGCKELPTNVFSGCSALASVVLNDGLETISDAAFANCKSLESISIPGTVGTIGTTQTSGPDKLPFYNCASLKSVKFEDGTLPLTLGVRYRDGYDELEGCGLFDSCPLEEVYIGRNISYKKVGYAYGYDRDFSESPIRYGYSAFYNQPKLAKVTISSTVTEIPAYLFYKNASLALTSLPKVKKIGASAFQDCSKLTTLNLGQDLQVVGNDAFNGCSNVTKLTFPDATTTIGARAFQNCSSVTEVTVGKELKTIGASAFLNCKSFTALLLPDEFTTMGESAFEDCIKLTVAKLGKSLTAVPARAFYGCKSLITATFEDGTDLIEMGYGASNKEYGLFRDCPIESLYLGRWLSYSTKDNTGNDAPNRAPFCHIPTLNNLTIGKNVGVIDKFMFSYCTGLEDVFLPDNITSVGMWGFRGCTSLKSVRLSQNLSQIADYGFSECSSLDNVVFPASMTSVADNSFSNCTSLRKLDLGSSLKIIGPSAFQNCTALKGVDMPKTLEGLGVESFAGCTSLPYVEVKGEVPSVGKQAFQGCTGLTWISLSENISSLGENSFEGCSNIKYVKSYATSPVPTGLVNFPEEVVANGTLFVPANVINNYKRSATWRKWGSIKAMTEDVFLSSLTLNQSDAHLKASETLALAATVGPDEATNKKVDWKSDDEAVASVSADGVVTAHKVGQTSIHAIANDGGGAKATCIITVDPTMVSSISLSQENLKIRKNHTAQLSAIVAPTDATNASFIWSSTNEDVAKVSEDGVISAIAPGDAVIKATSQDGSQVEASCQVKVLPVLKGDSNDDDEINVVDAVNTVNYIFNKVTGTFAFEAADVNSDDHISISDVTGTTDLIMQQVLQVKEQVAMAKGYGVSAMDDASSDRSLDCLVLSQQDKSNIDIALDNNSNFAALQADITLPVNVNDVEVKLSEVMATTHQLSYSKLNAHTLRVVVYSLSNSTFMDGQPIFCLSSKKNLDAKNIGVTNAIGSDVEAKGYRLTSRNNEVTSIDGIGVDGTSVKVVADGLMFTGLKGTPIYIYTTSGILVKTFCLASETSKIALQAGVYLVKMNGQVVKITVK